MRGKHADHEMAALRGGPAITRSRVSDLESAFQQFRWAGYECTGDSSARTANHVVSDGQRRPYTNNSVMMRWVGCQYSNRYC